MLHSIGGISPDGTLQTVASLPAASQVEIVEEDDWYFLIGYSSDGEFAGDSCFASIEEAKKQAKFEYEIDESDWTHNEETGK